MSQAYIDLRSDTVTHPTQAMRDAMYRAEVGDSMRGEDPTVNKLEALAAEKLGKEAALFVSSGTMGNLVAILAHTQPGDEVIFEADAHAYYYEVGGYARIGGLSPRIISGKHGVLDPAAIEALIRPASTFFPTPHLLLLENTHNRGGGNAIPVDVMASMVAVARRHNLAVHLDGARIFNAAVALGVNPKDIAAQVDSVQFCLSKGLSAPFGSLVVGSREYIQRAAKIRKLVGGDLRQAGIMAAAGIVALETMIDRLADDHRHAALLAHGLQAIPGVVIDLPPNPTNMVFIETAGFGLTAAEFSARVKEHGILAVPYATHRLRLVTHRHIGEAEVTRTIEAVRQVAAVPVTH